MKQTTRVTILWQCRTIKCVHPSTLHHSWQKNHPGPCPTERFLDLDGFSHLDRLNWQATPTMDKNGSFSDFFCLKHPDLLPWSDFGWVVMVINGPRENICDHTAGDESPKRTSRIPGLSCFLSFRVSTFTQRKSELKLREPSSRIYWGFKGQNHLGMLRAWTIRNLYSHKSGCTSSHIMLRSWWYYGVTME